MLELTNSFCRYFRVVQYVNYKGLKQFTHLNFIRKSCAESAQRNIFISYIPQNPHSKVFFNITKKLNSKQILLNTNDSKISKQMSESSSANLHHVSCGGQFVCSSEDTKEIVQQLTPSGSTSNSDVKRFSSYRYWEGVGKKGSDDGNGVKFRLMSYNVLAQYLLECHPYLYTECSSRDLKWKVRAARIYDEITLLDPDILCFQEVQTSHLNSFYAKFERKGYRGIFKQKTGHRHDGCAIYYRQSMFELAEHVTIEFYQPDLPILNRDNIGIIVKLIPKKSPSTPIVVATTHLLYNPKRTDVRLAQLQVLLAEIDRFAYYNNGKESGHHPIIITGDFNSTPESAVIKLLNNGRVRADLLRDDSDWKKIGVTDNCQHLSVYIDRQKGRATDYSAVKIYNSDYVREQQQFIDVDFSQTESEYNRMFNSGTLSHPLQLISVYDNQVSDKKKCPATTFQDYWVTVDYIYFSRCSNLKLIERLRLPTVSQCELIQNLPNEVYGSDHLSLAATFVLKQVKSSL